MKVREYLDAENWGQAASDALMPPKGKSCLAMAVNACYPKDDSLIPVFNKIHAVVGPAIPWNDDTKTTWADVQKLITDLDI